MWGSRRELEHKFDVIVVGAGPAGSTAAYTLAKMGYKTLLLERGRTVGSKNVFGGRVYATPLREIYPDFEKKAPIHRWVTKERVSLVYDASITSVEFEFNEKKSFTTYLSQLCDWMAKMAEGAGATVITEATVTSFYKEDGVYRGVVVGDEVVKSEVVVDAEGINRLLLEREGLVPNLKSAQVSLGVKEVLKMPPEVIENTFGLNPGEGLAWILMGDITDGIPGGAFIYTNNDSVSLGLVLLLENAITNIKDNVYAYVENLRIHPLLGKYLKDARIMEYSAHLIPEDVHSLRPVKLHHNGLLIVGDAAGFLLNLGYTYRGVDFAAYSGYLAAKSIEKSGLNPRGLSVYEDMIRDSFIAKNLSKFKTHDLMRNPRIFGTYPALLNEVAKQLFSIEYDSIKLTDSLKKAMKKYKVGWLSLIRDLVSVVRKL